MPANVSPFPPDPVLSPAERRRRLALTLVFALLFLAAFGGFAGVQVSRFERSQRTQASVAVPARVLAATPIFQGSRNRGHTLRAVQVTLADAQGTTTTTLAGGWYPVSRGTSILVHHDPRNSAYVELAGEHRGSLARILASLLLFLALVDIFGVLIFLQLPAVAARPGGAVINKALIFAALGLLLTGLVLLGAQHVAARFPHAVRPVVVAAS